MCGDGCNDCGALKTAHAGLFFNIYHGIGPLVTLDNTFFCANLCPSRHFALHGRGLCGGPFHLKERQHILRSLCHQVSMLNCRFLITFDMDHFLKQ